MPHRWISTDESVVVGEGPEEFACVTEALLTWRIHAGAGIEVEGPARVEPGADAVLRVRVGPLPLRAPVRILSVREDERSAGFTYRALPGHPEEGEESFEVRRAEDGTVRFLLHARSRPGTWSARIGAPVSRRVQRRFTRAYLDAAREIAAGAARP